MYVSFEDLSKNSMNTKHYIFAPRENPTRANLIPFSGYRRSDRSIVLLPALTRSLTSRVARTCETLMKRNSETSRQSRNTPRWRKPPRRTRRGIQFILEEPARASTSFCFHRAASSCLRQRDRGASSASLVCLVWEERVCRTDDSMGDLAFG